VGLREQRRVDRTVAWAALDRVEEGRLAVKFVTLAPGIESDAVPARHAGEIQAEAVLAEIVAVEAKPLAECVADLQKEFGPLHYRRLDLTLDPAQKQRALQRFAADDLRRVGDWTVVGREDLDGTKLYLLNAGWVLVRASGTEPVVRIYAEAPAAELAERVVAAVRGLVRSA